MKCPQEDFYLSHFLIFKSHPLSSRTECRINSTNIGPQICPAAAGQPIISTLPTKDIFTFKRTSSWTAKTVAWYSSTTSSTSWLISKLEMASDYTTKTRFSRNEKKKQSTRWIDSFVIWLERNSHDDVTKIDGNRQTNRMFCTKFQRNSKKLFRVQRSKRLHPPRLVRIVFSFLFMKQQRQKLSKSRK